MKTLTVRVSDEDYKKISDGAKKDKRTISNFMLASTMRQIEKAYYVTESEMEDIVSDRVLMKGLKKAHKDAAKKRGRYV